MKIGILGTGMIVKALMKTVDKLHFSRAVLLGTKETEEETKSMCREYGLDGYYLDYEELLDKVTVESVNSTQVMRISVVERRKARNL